MCYLILAVIWPPGLYSLLSASLLVFTKHPYSCIPLLSESESNCVYTLGRLLGADWLVYRAYCFMCRVPCISEQHAPGANSPSFMPYSPHLFAEGRPGRQRSELSHESLSELSCYLLCFPFALDLSSHTMSTVLQLYDSCGIVTSLVQVRALPFSSTDLTCRHKCDATRNNSGNRLISHFTS